MRNCDWNALIALWTLLLDFETLSGDSVIAVTNLCLMLKQAKPESCMARAVFDHTLGIGRATTKEKTTKSQGTEHLNMQLRKDGACKHILTELNQYNASCLRCDTGTLNMQLNTEHCTAQ